MEVGISSPAKVRGDVRLGANPRSPAAQGVAQQCRETQGRTLTFFSSNDSAVVDSDNNSRTLTQTGTNCQEPPQ